MKIKIDLIINDEKQLNYYLIYYNKYLNNNLNLFTNILWNKYYKLFNTNEIFDSPFNFFDKINLLKYTKNNKNNNNNNNNKKINNIIEYNSKNMNFIKYYYLFKKYPSLLDTDKTLIIIQNTLLFGHIESLLLFKKNNINILRFTNFNNVDKKIFDLINKKIKSYSKCVNKIYNEKNKPNLDIIKNINKKYDLIIFDLSNWLNISAEFLEISNSNLIYYAFIISLNLLNENGNLIISMGVNTKFSADILLLVKEYFNDCILDENYSLNFINPELYKIEVIFKGFRNNVKKDNLKKLENIFNKLIEINKTSHNYNVKNIIDRSDFFIIKPFNDNNGKSVFIHPYSLLNIDIKSNNYNFIRDFNNNLYNQKIKKLKNIIKLYKKKYNEKIPKKYCIKQFKISFKYLEKLTKYSLEKNTNILELYIINNKYVYKKCCINNIETNIFLYYTELNGKSIINQIFKFNDLLKIFLLKFIKKNIIKHNILKLTIEFQNYFFKIKKIDKVNIKLNNKDYINLNDYKDNIYKTYNNQLKRVKFIIKNKINLNDKEFGNNINKILKNIKLDNSLRFIYPYKINYINNNSK